MNDRVMDLLMDKMDSRRGRSGRYVRDRRDYARDRRDYEDGRRMSRGRSDYGEHMEHRDYEDGTDMRDYGEHSKLRLTKADLREWKQMMENADGTKGAHYDMQQIMTVADKLGVRFDEFSEGEFCIAVNMMYSDYCKTLKKYMSSDKLLECCVDLALDFLMDMDGPEPYEKIMLYYHCIVNA